MKHFLLFVLCIVSFNRAFCQEGQKKPDNSEKKLDTSSNSYKLTETLDSIKVLNEKPIKEIKERKIDSLNPNDLAHRVEDLSKKSKSIENYIKALNKKSKELKDQAKSLNEQTKNLNEQKKLISDQVSKSIGYLKVIQDSTKYKDSVIAAKTEKEKNIDSSIKTQEAILKERQSAITKQLDSLEVIAEIKMFDSIKVYDENRRALYWTHVNKIHIKVKEGVMLEIVVTTDSGVYRNKVAVIDLVHLGDRTHDILKYEPQKYRHNWEALYVYLDDAILYTPTQSYSDLPYADFDITLLPTDKDRSYLLRESTSINTYFNVAAFTDIKGISGEPNGIAQFTADAKFITNTRNIKNGATVPFHYISFHGGLAKFDNDFKGAPIYNDDSVSRKDLLQRSTYAIGFKLNLLRGFNSPYPRHLINDWQINVGYNFLGTKIFDTLFKDVAKTVMDTTYKTATQNQWYIEPIVTFSRHRNFSMNLTLPLYFNSIKASAKIKNFKNETWAAPGISLMYFGKRDTGNKLFFRYNHFINLKDKTQAFSQMQLGYSVNLTDVWGSNTAK